MTSYTSPGVAKGRTDQMLRVEHDRLMATANVGVRRSIKMNRSYGGNPKSRTRIIRRNIDGDNIGHIASDSTRTDFVWAELQAHDVGVAVLINEFTFDDIMTAPKRTVLYLISHHCLMRSAQRADDRDLYQMAKDVVLDCGAWMEAIAIKHRDDIALPFRGGLLLGTYPHIATFIPGDMLNPAKQAMHDRLLAILPKQSKWPGMARLDESFIAATLATQPTTNHAIGDTHAN